MRKQILMALVFGGFIAAGSGANADTSRSVATETVPAPIARGLDEVPVDYVRHTRAHRHAEIQHNMRRQQMRGHRYGPRAHYRGGPPGHYRRHGGPPPGHYRRGW